MNGELSEDLGVGQFDFHLPAEQIAQHPAEERTQSRLLIVGDTRQNLHEIRFSELEKILNPGDLLVCNDSKVIPARLQGRKETGGKVEILVERIVGEYTMWAQMKSRKSCKIGTTVTIGERFRLTVNDRKRDLFVLETNNMELAQTVIEQCGSVPLPPYIDRVVEKEDAIRYQTVYARNSGSVAAPTAGLHFSEKLIQKLQDYGVRFAYVTLHVGVGTFAPIREINPTAHTLHSERFYIPESVSEAIMETQQKGFRVIAVGTTSMRALETAAADGCIKPFSGETNLFIKPGFRFQVVDALMTNFHLPRSTLLMLVCAFGGTKRILKAYRHAVDSNFRFYSYGDAMFIEPER